MHTIIVLVFVFAVVDAQLSCEVVQTSDQDGVVTCSGTIPIGATGLSGFEDFIYFDGLSTASGGTNFDAVSSDFMSSSPMLALADEGMSCTTANPCNLGVGGGGFYAQFDRVLAVGDTVIGTITVKMPGNLIDWSNASFGNIHWGLQNSDDLIGEWTARVIFPSE
jgi:hypothetical protein